MRERDDIETFLFDVCDFELPHDNYGTEIGNLFPEWRDAIIRADGLVIVTPEYNHGYPGTLKAVLDLLLKEYIHKAVAFVGVSAGPWGGCRVIEACVPMVRELGLAVTFTDLNFPAIKNKFDADGNFSFEMGPTPDGVVLMTRDYQADPKTGVARRVDPIRVGGRLSEAVPAVG